MSNTVIVLGNGFDLDLGLRTSYSDFINATYLNRDESKRERTNPLIDAMLDKYKDAGWVDIEMFLREYALYYSGKELESERDIQSEYGKLCSDLNSYMYADKYPNVTGDVYNIHSSAFKLLHFAINQDAEIYSLNYTDLKAVMDFESEENVFTANITYMHGKCTSEYARGEVPIILGIDSAPVREEFKCMIKLTSNHYKPGIISALDEAKNVIFFGVGLGVTDEAYFKGFFRKILNGETGNIRIFVFTNGDGTDFFYRVSQMIGEENLCVFREKDIHIYNTSIKNIYDEFVNDFNSYNHINYNSL